MLYPFGMEAIIHIPTIQQQNKLVPSRIECRILKPLITGGWLLWDPNSNKMVQSASIIFSQFQPSKVFAEHSLEGLITHILNAMTLEEVPTERYFTNENKEISSLPMAKDIHILDHLSKALSCQHSEYWKRVCMKELAQISGKFSRWNCT
ncbi:hypothetical protein O181_000187 [Austropuccinia psidii MF-1]|uniref:Uncharacterized protein n=1 Tax=Austropuccinia psidii MF-1 TaxID=1389203 RepID=A0A9Q3B8C4_9BASI|nr:hypothetical protein [Austropuccinia psidii MF-1]